LISLQQCEKGFRIASETALDNFRGLYKTLRTFVRLTPMTADCLYGNSPEFWAACEVCVGTVAFVAVPEETRCWLAPVAPTTQSYTYKG